MARLAVPLSLVSLAVLAACATRDPNYPDRPTPVATAPVVVSTGQPVVTSGTPILYSSGPVAPGTPIVAGASVFKPGMGTVDSIQTVRITSAAQASAGSSQPDRLAYRLTVRMDDGSLQAIDQDNRNFAVGDRVEIASNGQIVRR